jgi:hypothetical protein
MVYSAPRSKVVASSVVAPRDHIEGRAGPAVEQLPVRAQTGVMTGIRYTGPAGLSGKVPHSLRLVVRVGQRAGG